MKFSVGQRIKKVRGDYSIGATAVALRYDELRPGRFNLWIRVDRAAYATRCGYTREVPAGTEGITDPALWEPIIPDGSAPSEFTTLHDLLTSLEGVAA
jgi:hypothetical protein